NLCIPGRKWLGTDGRRRLASGLGWARRTVMWRCGRDWRQEPSPPCGERVGSGGAGSASPALAPPPLAPPRKGEGRIGGGTIAMAAVRPFALTALILACVLGLTACGKGGAPARAPERGDQAVAKVGDDTVWASDVKREAVAQGLLGEGEPLEVSSDLFHRVLDEVID